MNPTLEGSTLRGTDRRIGVVTGPGSLRFERVLPGPIERVWSFLTATEKMALWMASGTIDARVGGKFEWHCDYGMDQPGGPGAGEKAPVVHGEILEWDPPRRLRTTWDYSGCANASGDGTITELTYELFPRGDRVLLVLTHTLLPNLNDIRAALAGWHLHLDILADVLAGKAPAPFWKTHQQLEAVYREGV